MAPAGASEITPACAPICAPRPIRRWPAIAAWPPTRTKSSRTVDPEMPTCATMTQHRPRRTLCPICTRLSRREPAPITVSRIDPRSIVVLAPTSTSSSKITRPSWGAVRNPALVEAKPNPSCPMRAPADTYTRAQRVAQAGMCANPAIGPDYHTASDYRARADPAAGADLCSGLNHRQRSDFRRGIDARTLGDNCRRVDTGGNRRHGMEQCSHPRPAFVWLAGNDRHRRCRHPGLHIGMHDHRILSEPSAIPTALSYRGGILSYGIFIGAG